MGFLNNDGVIFLWGKIKEFFVAKESGKGLSTNDYTTAEKGKLATIEIGAKKGDMLKSVYDTDGDGVVDNAKKVDGHTVGVDVPTDAKFTDVTISEVSCGENNVLIKLSDGVEHGILPASDFNGGIMSRADYVKLSGLPTGTELSTLFTGIERSYAKKEDVTGVYKYKGSVASASALPTTGQTKGDVYNIESVSIYGSAGSNVAWDGSKWDSLGEIFTITAITNSELDTICV